MAASDVHIGSARPAHGAETVTPSDTDELAFVSRSLYVGSDGNVAVVMRDGMTVTFENVPAGSILPIEVRQVLDTGTTSGMSIVSIY